MWIRRLIAPTRDEGAKGLMESFFSVGNTSSRRRVDTERIEKVARQREMVRSLTQTGEFREPCIVTGGIAYARVDMPWR